MAFLGKTYTLQSEERFEEFLASIGVPKERIAAMKAAQRTEVWEKNGDKYTFTLHNKPTTFQSGVEFEDNSSGSVVKTTIVVDGNTVTETKKSPGITITFKKVFTGDKLVVTATNSKWDGVAMRTFVA